MTSHPEKPSSPSHPALAKLSFYLCYRFLVHASSSFPPTLAFDSLLAIHCAAYVAVRKEPQVPFSTFFILRSYLPPNKLQQKRVRESSKLWELLVYFLRVGAGGMYRGRTVPYHHHSARYRQKQHGALNQCASLLSDVGPPSRRGSLVACFATLSRNSRDVMAQTDYF
jgi:hypothetical protein